MICVKLHSNSAGSVFAACDEEIVGKTFEENGTKILVSESFYKDEVVSEEEFAKRIREQSVLNLIGEKTVSIAVREGLVDVDYVITVAGVKHAQVVR